MRNPRLLSDPAFITLMQEAYNNTPHAHDFTYAEVFSELTSFITAEDRFLLAAFDNGEPVAVCYGDLPTSRMFPFPMLHVMYSKGGRAVTNCLKNALLDFLTERGYTKLMALNGTGRDDATWLRALTPNTTSSHKIGTLHLIEV